MADSYLSESEVDALQSSGLHRKTPFVIQDVSRSQLSIARHFGGAKFNGDHYDYIPPTDELVREDVVQWLLKRREIAAQQV